MRSLPVDPFLKLSSQRFNTSRTKHCFIVSCHIPKPLVVTNQPTSKLSLCTQMVFVYLTSPERHPVHKLIFLRSDNATLQRKLRGLSALNFDLFELPFLATACICFVANQGTIFRPEINCSCSLCHTPNVREYIHPGPTKNVKATRETVHPRHLACHSQFTRPSWLRPSAFSSPKYLLHWPVCPSIRITKIPPLLRRLSSLAGPWRNRFLVGSLPRSRSSGSDGNHWRCTTRIGQGSPHGAIRGDGVAKMKARGGEPEIKSFR